MEPRNPMDIPYQEIHMLRRNLDGVPRFPLPAGFTLRHHRPGDRKTWLRIHHACYDAEGRIAITPELFDEQFGTDPKEFARRQLFLCDPAGNAVGTITAWKKTGDDGRVRGQIHWVAILPSHRGRGLAKPMLAAAMNLLHDLGHDCAWLGTQTVRLPAIRLYLAFGFLPDRRNPEEAEAWARLREILALPRSPISGNRKT